MKLYLAGPMTGIPRFNIPAFDNFSAMLREEGHEVISPSELDDPEDRAAAYASPDGGIVHYSKGKTWGDFLARDIKLIMDTPLDAIAVLYGWEKSKGARFETFTGNAMKGLPVYSATSLLWTRHEPIERLTLYRAWCADMDITLNHSFGKVPA